MVTRKSHVVCLVPLLFAACSEPANETVTSTFIQAEPADAEAQYNLALRYYDGESGTPEYGAARDWYESAAEQGHAPAQFNLALMHYDGEGGVAPVNGKNPIQLTSDSVWSSERSGTGSAWYFFFARGYRNSLQLINPSGGRVLCVRVP